MEQLDTQVRNGLEQRRGEWRLIAEKAEVSHSWISQFVRGKIPNPGFATLQKLQRTLADGGAPTPADVAREV